MTNILDDIAIASPSLRNGLVSAPDHTLAGLVSTVVELQRLINASQALQNQLMASISDHCLIEHSADNGGYNTEWNPEGRAHMVALTELATALRVPERTMNRRMNQAIIQRDSLPETMGRFLAGELTLQHAAHAAEHTALLDPELRGGFDAHIAPTAQSLTASAFDRSLRRLRESIDPASILAKHTKERADRYVSVEPAEHGMAWLTAFIPASAAYAIEDRLRSHALALKTHDEERTLAQLRADTFVEVALFGDVAALGFEGVRASVSITVPALSLLGHSDEPAILEGYGPIDLDQARILCANATSFTRIITDPISGAILEISPKQYSIPAAIRRLKEIEDGTCRFPGCRTRAANCDLDHLHERQHGGDHHPNNLTHLCRRHHALRHETEWHYEHDPSGDIVWTSPSGRTTRTEAHHPISVG